MKDKKYLITIVLLAVVLFMNLLTWLNTRELEDQTTRLQNEIHNIQTRVSHEVAGIRSTVQNIREEERWWTPANIDYVNKTGPQEVEVKISWQLREYKDGSKVMFNYSPGEKEKFKEIEASRETGGRFFVVLPVEIPMTPSLDIQVNKNRDTSKSTNIVEEKVSPFNDNLIRYRYYISLQEGNSIRTAETRTLDLSKLSLELFNPLELYINVQNENEFSANLNELKIKDPEYKISGVHIESRKRDQIIEKWTLAPLENERAKSLEQNNIYNTEIRPEKSYDSFYIVINYTGGLTIEERLPKTILN